MVSEATKNQLENFQNIGFTFDFDSDGYMDTIEYQEDVVYEFGDTTDDFKFVPIELQTPILDFFEKWNNDIDTL